MWWLGCGGLARTFFDLPPPGAREDGKRTGGASTTMPPPVDETVRPLIEASLDPDSALALLPTDAAGHVDWAEAIRSGVIAPRPSVGGTTPPANDRFRFEFDFYYKGPAPLFDAFFPHSTHTEWISCRQCHGAVFKYREPEITMSAILGGKFCGACHGKVAFPVVTGCDRCHRGLVLPPGRASAEFLGTIVMQRAPRDTTLAPEIIKGVAAGTSDLPPAVFPHWLHRIRYQCKACHPDTFEPRAGANRVLMKDIENGKACGVCHNGNVAFRPAIGGCQRCHFTPVNEAERS